MVSCRSLLIDISNVMMIVCVGFFATWGFCDIFHRLGGFDMIGYFSYVLGGGIP
jgi:hypothetical protein